MISRKDIRLIFFPIISSYISIISPYIVHIIGNKGGLMVFVKSPSRGFNDYKIPSNIQIIPFEINLRKEKLLVHQFTTLHSRKTNILSGI